MADYPQHFSIIELASSVLTKLNQIIDAGIERTFASGVSYDNTVSGLTSSDVNGAIDEVNGLVDTAVDDANTAITIASAVDAKIGEVSVANNGQFCAVVDGKITPSYKIATQVEAEGGTSSTTLMTPERTDQAINSLSPNRRSLRYYTSDGELLPDGTFGPLDFNEPDARQVQVTAIGGGGGAYAASTPITSSTAIHPAASGGAARAVFSAIGFDETITIGTGGTSGTTPTDGADSSFGLLIVCGGGNKGQLLPAANYDNIVSRGIVSYNSHDLITILDVETVYNDFVGVPPNYTHRPLGGYPVGFSQLKGLFDSTPDGHGAGGAGYRTNTNTYELVDGQPGLVIVEVLSWA